jgi:hypothetical protein
MTLPQPGQTAPYGVLTAARGMCGIIVPAHMSGPIALQNAHCVYSTTPPLG